MTRVDFANEVMNFFYTSIRVPSLENFVKIENVAMSYSDTTAFEMHHPKSLPDLIARGNSLEKYVKCIANASSWKDHLSKFLNSYAVVNMLDKQLATAPTEIQAKIWDNCSN